MRIDYWRAKLKAGPFREVYRIVRAFKRKLRGEALAGFAPPNLLPLSVEELREAAAGTASHDLTEGLSTRLRVRSQR
jgi:hypothetical protein